VAVFTTEDTEGTEVFFGGDDARMVSSHKFGVGDSWLVASWRTIALGAKWHSSAIEHEKRTGRKPRNANGSETERVIYITKGGPNAIGKAIVFGHWQKSRRAGSGDPRPTRERGFEQEGTEGTEFLWG
jgi:hypothetical protein